MSQELLRAGDICLLVDKKGEYVWSYVVLTDPFLLLNDPTPVVLVSVDGKRIAPRYACKSRYNGWKIK